jgi:cyclic lactone autoinducer peptide
MSKLFFKIVLVLSILMSQQACLAWFYQPEFPVLLENK